MSTAQSTTKVKAYVASARSVAVVDGVKWQCGDAFVSAKNCNSASPIDYWLRTVVAVVVVIIATITMSEVKVKILVTTAESDFP